jgi:predicted nuclease of predicted toxin-antitoxin system
MKLIFDQNISHRVLQFLSSKFDGSTTVKAENLIDRSDREIWEFARSKSYIIVTQDSDFNDLNLLYGFPPKVIWIRTGNLPTASIAKILNDYESEIEKFSLDSGFGCLEIFTITK